MWFECTCGLKCVCGRARVWFECVVRVCVRVGGAWTPWIYKRELGLSPPPLGVPAPAGL